MRRVFTVGLFLGLALASTSCITTGRRKAEMLEDEVLELPKIEFSGDVFVDFKSRCEEHAKLAVLPFRAAVELTGASSSDFFITELMKTMRYDLIERSQMDSVLKEQQLQLSGVTDDAAAVRVGRMLGVRGVVVGTVSEYGFQRVRIARAPSVGLSVRMIDTETGKVVWSVSHSQVGDKALSLSQHAKDVIGEMVMALSAAWNDAGDRLAAGLPAPRGLRAEAGLRTVSLSWKPHSSKVIAGYEIRRKGPNDRDYRLLVRLKNQRGADMEYVDRGLKDLTLYTYEIRTVSSYGLVSAETATAETITAGPPPPVSGLKAEPDGPRRVKLTWMPLAEETVTGYRIVRYDPDGMERTVGRVGDRRTASYEDHGRRGAALADSTEYAYAVVAANRVGLESAVTEKARAKTAPPPSPVQGLQASKGLPAKVTVRWQANPADEQIDRYVISRRATERDSFRQVGSVRPPQTAFTDDGQALSLENGAQYAYEVRAVNVAGGESKSVSAVGETKPGPTAVTGLSASTDQLKSVKLSWQPHASKAVISYAIYRAFAADGPAQKVTTVPASEQSYTHNYLRDSTTYYYLVRAVDRDGLEGKPCARARGTTKAPPPAPQQLACRAEEAGAVLTWAHDNPQGVDQYTVYLHGMLSSRPIGTSAKEQFVYDKASPGKTYKFSVDAVGQDGLRSRRSPVKAFRFQRNQE